MAIAANHNTFCFAVVPFGQGGINFRFCPCLAKCRSKNKDQFFILIHTCCVVVCVQSLCNACGIKYRKKRREALGLESGTGGVKKENKRREEGEREKKSKSKSSIKLKIGLGGEVVINKKKRKMMMKMGEEERAAILLMALSSGCVHG